MFRHILCLALAAVSDVAATYPFGAFQVQTRGGCPGVSNQATPLLAETFDMPTDGTVYATAGMIGAAFERADLSLYVDGEVQTYALRHHEPHSDTATSHWEHVELAWAGPLTAGTHTIELRPGTYGPDDIWGCGAEWGRMSITAFPAGSGIVASYVSTDYGYPTSAQASHTTLLSKTVTAPADGLYIWVHATNINRYANRADMYVAVDDVRKAISISHAKTSDQWKSTSVGTAEFLPAGSHTIELRTGGQEARWGFGSMWGNMVVIEMDPSFGHRTESKVGHPYGCVNQPADQPLSTITFNLDHESLVVARGQDVRQDTGRSDFRMHLNGERKADTMANTAEGAYETAAVTIGWQLPAGEHTIDIAPSYAGDPTRWGCSSDLRRLDVMIVNLDTFAPTASPTNAPTGTPTATPTNAPTLDPTAVPTVVPTAAPSATPTVVPTAAPSAVPTDGPTDSPTTEAFQAIQLASAALSVHPWTTGVIGDVAYKCHDFDGCYENTAALRKKFVVATTEVDQTQLNPEPQHNTTDGSFIFSDDGIVFVSTDGMTEYHFPHDCQCSGATPLSSTLDDAIEDFFPTDAPTDSPTVVPTDAPTNAPTVDPTDSPSAAPSAAPSVAPTDSPSAAPSVAPTNAPTGAPTDAPTAAPTIAIHEYPSCGGSCLSGGVYQTQGDIYRIGGFCYQATSGCQGCLDLVTAGDPYQHPGHLELVACPDTQYTVSEWPTCSPGCLYNSANQLQGRVYKFAGDYCYIAISICQGCLDLVDPGQAYPALGHLGLMATCPV